RLFCLFERVPPRAFQVWYCWRAGTFRPRLLKVVPGKNRYRPKLSSLFSEVKAEGADRRRATAVAEAAPPGLDRAGPDIAAHLRQRGAPPRLRQCPASVEPVDLGHQHLYEPAGRRPGYRAVSPWPGRFQPDQQGRIVPPGNPAPAGRTGWL